MKTIEERLMLQMFLMLERRERTTKRSLYREKTDMKG